MTIAIRPLVEWMGEFGELICPKKEAEYFFGRDWTGQITLKALTKIAEWRRSIFTAAQVQSARGAAIRIMPGLVPGIDVLTPPKQERRE